LLHLLNFNRLARPGARGVRPQNKEEMNMRARVWLAIIILAVWCGCGPAAESKKKPSPEQRVSNALASQSETFVRDNLALIPKGTPGREKVAQHLSELQGAINQAAENSAKEKTAIAAQNEAKAQKALQAMRKVEDKVQSVTFYYDKGSPQYINTRSEMWLYIAKAQGAQPELRLKITYVADDWLFIERFFFKTDKGTLELNPGSAFALKRDNEAGKVWEWYDAPVGPDELKVISAIVNSKETVMRYEGQQYNKDRTLSAAEKQRLVSVIEASTALVGK
jgi:hypothetical protein